MSSILVANIGISYWAKRSFRDRGGDGIKPYDWGMEGIVIIANWKYHFIREAKEWCNIHVILYQFLKACTILYVLVAKLLFISSMTAINYCVKLKSFTRLLFEIYNYLVITTINITLFNYILSNKIAKGLLLCKHFSPYNLL